MKKNFIMIGIIIGIILLVVGTVSAISLKLDPSKIKLNGKPDTELCSKLTIEYSMPDGSVEGRDLWADFSEEGVVEKDLSLHTLDAKDLGLTVTYPKTVSVTGSNDVDICVTAEKEGLYHGALLYKTMQSGGVGIELNIWITVDTKTPYFEKDEPKEISGFQTDLEITTSKGVSGWVEISKYGNSIGKPYGKELLGDLIEINAPEVGENLKSVTIKKYYTLEELNGNILDEDSLRLYYYNGGSWEQLNSNVNKNAKYVSATVNHFSVFGIFGNVLEVPSKPVVVDDGDSTTSTTSLHAQWTSNSEKSKISGYKYAIGTSPEATNIVDWTSTTQTSVTITGLSLNVGKTYYFSVKAKNNRGWSETGVSNGIKIIEIGSSNTRSSGGGGGGSSSRSLNFGEISYENEGTNKNPEEDLDNILFLGKMTGGTVKNFNGEMLIVMPIILLTMVVLIGIIFIKRTKKGNQPK